MSLAKPIGIVVSAAILFSSAAFAMEHEGKMMEAKVKCAGVNSCQGKTQCKSANNACKGQNSCKGKGWEFRTEKACKKEGGTVMTDQ